MENLTIPGGAVVVGVDGSVASDRAAAWAAHLASVQGRPLVVLHAADPATSAVAWLAQAGIDPTGYLDQEDLAAAAIAEGAVDRCAAAHPGLHVTAVRSHQDPRNALLQASAVAGTVVVGSRGLGPVGGLVLGSVSSAVAAHGAAPVVVVRPHHPGKVRQGVLVGVDATEGATAVLEFAFRRAAELSLPLTALHTVPAPYGEATAPRLLNAGDADFEEGRLALAEAIAGLTEKFPEVYVRPLVVRGFPAAALVEEAARMDLVVLGHRRRAGLTGLLHASVARSVLEHAQTVVAVVPEP